MLDYTEEETVLFQALNLDGAMGKWLDFGKNRDDYLAVLRMAKELFYGDLAVLALLEGDTLVALDDQGRSSSVQFKEETKNELNILLNLANDTFQLSSSEMSLLIPLLGEGESLKSLMFKVIPTERGKQGLLLIGSKRRNSFSRQENQFLGLFVTNINLTLRNHQFSTHVDRMSQALVALQEIGAAIGTNDFEKFIELVLQKLTHLIGAENGGILLYDEEKQELVLQSPSFGAQEEEINLYRLSVRQDRPPELRTVEVFLQRKSFISNDAPTEKKYLQQFIKLFKIRECLSIPLFIDQKGIGVLHLVNKHQGYFTEQDVQISGVFTTKLAVLIENARLVYQTKQQEREARALLQAGIEISTFLDLKALLPSIVDKARKLLACDMAAITTLEEEGHYAHLTYGNGDAVEEVRYIRVTPGKGLTGQVLANHNPLACVLGTLPPKFIREYDDIDLIVRGKGQRSAIAVPLIIDSKMHGVLYVWRKKEESFSSREIKLLSRFSNQVTITLQNACFFSEQRKSLAGLQSSKQFSETQYAMLARSVSIHKELIQKVLLGEGIKSIASSLAQVVNGKVKVTDKFFRLMACVSKDSADEVQDKVIYLYDPAELMSNDSLREFFEQLAGERYQCNYPVCG